MNIPLARPNISENDINEVVQVLQSGMLVQGKKVEQLEHKIATYLNIPYCSALSNGTATLHTALLSLGIKKDDEVIVPAFSYIATANVVELIGAKPVFCDIDIKTFNIDPTQIERKITNRTKAIIPVHEFGLSADMDPIMKIAKEYNLYVLEDAACALGAKYNNRYCGTFGEFGSFSLHPRKAITSGEGGLLITKNEELNHKIKTIRNHGINSKNTIEMEFTEAGFNYRLTDIQAALVLNQIDKLSENLEIKNNIAQQYNVNLKQSVFELPFVPENSFHSWQTYHVLVKNNKRDHYIKDLRSKGVGTNYGAQCIPMMKYYQDKYKNNCEKDFPNAKNAFENGLAVPIYETLSTKETEHIINTLNQLN